MRQALVTHEYMPDPGCLRRPGEGLLKATKNTDQTHGYAALFNPVNPPTQRFIADRASGSYLDWKILNAGAALWVDG